MSAWYCTREEVKRELESAETARSNAAVDRKIEAASRGVDLLCHRRFYPEEGTRYFAWPNPQRARSWRLWLDDSELISITSLSSGGVAIPDTDFFLEPNRSGPPYRSIELDLDSSAAWGGGATHQRDITVTGLWGYRDDEAPAGALDGAVNAAVTTLTVTDSSAVGVGTVLRTDTERLIVTGRTMADTGQTLAAGLTAQANSVTLTVADGGVFAVDEVLLVDSERMLIVDIAGDTLTVKRAWDGSVLAAHAIGAGIYAPRTLTVERGALGTTASAHDDGATLARWEPPGPVRELAVAETLNMLLQGQAGWARVTSTGGSSAQEAKLLALQRLRDQVYNSHGRKARTRAV